MHLLFYPLIDLRSFCLSIVWYMHFIYYYYSKCYMPLLYIRMYIVIGLNFIIFVCPANGINISIYKVLHFITSI